MATARLRLTGDELRDIRQLLGLTQAQLARRIRVSRVSVGRWESGLLQMRPSHAVAVRLLVKVMRKQDVKRKIDDAIAASRREPVWSPDRVVSRQVVEIDAHLP